MRYPLLGVIALVTAFGALSVVLVLALLTLGKLLEREYREHYADWEADGKPRGAFSRLPAPSFFEGGSIAYQWCAFKWMFTTPYWMQQDAEATRLVRQLRWYVGIWYFAFTVIVVGFGAFGVGSK